MRTCIILCLSLVSTQLCGLEPQNDWYEETCDMIELNHHYDYNGKLIFTQLLFWNWQSVKLTNEGESREIYTRIILDWRMVGSTTQAGVKYFQIQKVGNYYSCVLQDAVALRKIRAKVYKETWLQIDPEVKNRELVNTNSRQKLIIRKFQ